MYPIFARLFPMYNNPLVQLVQSTYLALGRKIVVVDVGAAIGDTMLLLLQNCPEMIDKFYCIEGDDEFYYYLKNNLKNISNAILINELLSDIDDKRINDLVKIHPGTASSIGHEKRKTKSLDTLILSYKPVAIDIIKIDVDGYDGTVLKGSEKLLELYKPNIIFEWHPIHIQNTGNEFELPFKILNRLGYTKFIWFTKYGTFSHFDLDNDKLSRSEWNQICLRNIYDYDYHFDIISIHKDSNINISDLVELQFVKNKISI